MYWSVSPAARTRQWTPSGIPIGLASDAAYFGESLIERILHLLVVPPHVADTGEMETWRKRTIEHLLRGEDLTLVSVWSPTFLLELVRHIREQGHDSDLWPHLDTISCWANGSSARFIPELNRLFPHAWIQGKGLLATEGVVSVPLANAPHPVLALRSAFYEFTDGEGRTHLSFELEEGREYGVIITTHSGLYRYNLQDRIRVHGKFEGLPMLEFVSRGNLVSDICGEKLTEEFVLPRLRGIEGFAMIAPAVNGTVHYVLFLDREIYGDSSAAAIAARIDSDLSDNPQYAYARRLGQLGPLTAQLVSHPVERFCARELQAGRKLGDIKIPVLSRKAPFAEDL
jgi:hypothetical protein